jgi:hypothetical protein
MRSALFALLSIALGLSAVFVCVEIGMRVVGISYPIFFVPHPVAGARMWPGLKAWYTLEGEGFVEVNSTGFRDREHPKKKPEGVYRIAFLGDSYTEAMQVGFDETYWNVAARALEDCDALSGRKPVPMNFGLSGIGTAQQYEILRHFVADQDPDLVVLAFVSNDIYNNHPAYGGRDLKPFYVLGDNGDLVLDDSFKNSSTFLGRISPLRTLRRSVLQSSRVLQLVVEVRASMVRRASLRESRNRHDNLYRPPETEALRESWQITEALIARMAEEIASLGSEFLLFTVTTGHQVHPDPGYRRDRVSAEAGEDLNYWNNRLGAWAGSKGIDFVDLAPPLLSHVEASGECLHGFENAVSCGGHWNARGHRLAGEEIARAICFQLGSREKASRPHLRGTDRLVLDRAP